jgi:hypothetical protein
MYKFKKESLESSPGSKLISILESDVKDASKDKTKSITEFFDVSLVLSLGIHMPFSIDNGFDVLLSQIAESVVSQVIN